jgi:3-oxoacyl-(acyl-carrier-protein) synthase
VITDDAVAIVGMGMVAPGCASPEEFWRLLHQDSPAFTEPGERWDLDTLYSSDPRAQDRVCLRRMGYIHDGFPAHPGTDSDAGPPLDEFGRWLRHAALQALCGVRVAGTDRCAALVGATAEGSQRLEEQLIIEAAARFFGTDADDADRLRHVVRGLYPRVEDEPAAYTARRQAMAALADTLPGISELTVLDSACSTASYTVDLGVKALLGDECEVALCAAAFVLSRRTSVLYSQVGVYARSGDLRAYDRACAGTLFSDGAAALVLKRHARALADGDRIHGFVLGTGGSTDGRGKGIMAPNPEGQLLAFRRALDHAGLEPEELQLIVGHGTGTPVGDLRELEMLRRAAGARARWPVVSNKSLIGHTGWTAGIISVIHALQALHHQVIPAQQRFDAVPDGKLLGEQLLVPRAPVSWRAGERARVVGVCSYGLGGSNCCLIVADRPAAARSPATTVPRDPRAAILAWDAYLPGAADPRDVELWLRDGCPSWPLAFPDPYPSPPSSVTTLPPRTHGSLDRSHLIAMEAADALARRTDLCWSGREGRTGVFVAQMGPTKASIDYALRAGAEDLTRRIERRAAADPGISPTDLVADVRRAIPRGDSDTYTGFIANVIASRIAVQFDLHGPTLAFDTGTDSTLTALHAARRWLAAGELDFALVLALSANAAYGRAFEDEEPNAPTREGVFTFLLASPDVMNSLDAHPLATFGAVPGSTEPDSLPTARHIPAGYRGYQAADSAIRVLRALTGHRPSATIDPVTPIPIPSIQLTMATPPDGPIMTGLNRARR